jgi:hypothetical protein
MSDSLTIAIPLNVTRLRHGHQRLRPTPTETSASLVVALSRAYAWQAMLRQGVYRSVHALATGIGCDTSYVARTLNLALLAPDIIEAILHGQVSGLTLQSMPKALPVAWAEQRHMLGLPERVSAPSSVTSLRAPA